MQKMFLITTIILTFAILSAGVWGGDSSEYIFKPDYVFEPNGNGATILSQIKEDDNIWNNNWVVCSGSYLGSVPMTVTYVLFGNRRYLETAELEFESKISGDNAIFDITCGTGGAMLFAQLMRNSHVFLEQR